MNKETTPVARPDNMKQDNGMRETPKWQPIETAPKDGTDIIVGFDFATVWIVHVAWYRDGSPESGAEDADDIGWWSYVRHSVTQEKLDGYHTPTHWIPLPELPGDAAIEGSKQGEGG